MATYTYQTKRCPKCGKVYERRTVTGPYGRESLYKFGPIFATCSSCGAVFRDSSSYELAIMDPPAEMVKKFHVSSIILASLLGIVGLVTFISDSAAHPFWFFLICLVIGGGILWGDYRRYTNNIARIDRERALSKKRLKQNPEYVKQLQAAGYSIPDEYLPGKDK